MILIEKINLDLKSAMIEKNLKKLSILRVLKSELQRIEQTSNGKIILTDADVVKVVKKMIEGVKLTSNDENELGILNVFLPKQLTNEQIKETLSILGLNNLGEIMKYFKTNFDGQYDGKILSNIIKEML
jgi:uncharacterized protein YqeY